MFSEILQPHRRECHGVELDTCRKVIIVVGNFIQLLSDDLDSTQRQLKYPVRRQGAAERGHMQESVQVPVRKQRRKEGRKE